jgi:inner membrane protein
MDNLTHTLTGVLLSRAGLNRFYARPTLLLALAANAPDVDVISLLGGPLNYIEYHRWLTHSIAMLPVMAALPVLLVCALRRTMDGWKAAYALSLIGVASHLLLDSTNIYGIRLLLPFSSAWQSLDITNIVDVWIWALLLTGWIGPLLGKLVSSEMGAKPGSGRGLAIAMLSLLTIYEFGRYLAHQRAVETLEARVYRGAAPVRAAAFAVDSNPLHWKGWVRGPNFSERFDMNLLMEFDPQAGTVIYDPDAPRAIEAARGAEVFRKYAEFARYPIWRVTPAPDPEGWQRVDLTDWRFGFTASALEDGSGRVQRAWFHF